MLLRTISTALALMLACPLGIGLAHADIYTWIDKSGTINVSNLSPPDGVEVTNVTRESPPRKSGDADSPDVQTLAERVRQLEQELDFAKRQPPPPMPYPVVQAPPMSYPVVPPPPDQYSPVQYQIIEAPAASNGYGGPANYGCDPTGWQCGSWWGPGFYPPAVVFVGAPFFRPFPPHGHGGRGSMPKPGQLPAAGVPHGIRRG